MFTRWHSKLSLINASDKISFKNIRDEISIGLRSGSRIIDSVCKALGCLVIWKSIGKIIIYDCCIRISNIFYVSMVGGRFTESSKEI